MTTHPKIESSEYSDLNKVIGWFITLRWIACGGVLFTLLAADLFLLPERSFVLLYILNGLLFLVNLCFLLYYRRVKDGNLSRREMAVFFHTQVCCDYILLFLNVYFTGFLENPAAYFFVFHIILTSFIFSSRVVYMYLAALIALFCATACAQAYTVLPYYPLGLIQAPHTYYDSLFLRLAGLSSTLVITAYLITSVKSRIEERGRSVEIELDRYKSLDKIKSNFILQVTHELRGPVAALKGYHEMMLKGITGAISEKTEQAIHKADVRTQNLLNIIDEMIDYAYMKSKEDVRFNKAEVNLRDAIAKNIDLYRQQAGKKSITLSSSCPADMKVVANPDLLDIIFSNLITNAIKYSHERTTVWVTATQDRGMADIQVKDQGIGMEPGEIEMIFDEFFRSRRAREMERDGTGLGLSIVQRVVDVLGGKITVYSEQGKGSNFHVFLPVP
jgi:signal transduction histidine kinase